MELCKVLTFKQFCWLRRMMREYREEQNRFIDSVIHEARLRELEPERKPWWKIWS